MFQYFKQLAPRASHLPLSKLKFKRLEPFVLPLTSYPIVCSEATVGNWSLARVSRQGGDLYQSHLILPRFNRVNTRYYLDEDKLKKEGIVVRGQPIIYHCKNLNPFASLDTLLIGLHPNRIISLMAIPRSGTSLKLCQALSGSDSLPELELLHNDSLVNQHAYQFAAHAGVDPRPRATLQVHCDNEHDINRVRCFIAGIQKIITFDESIKDLWQDIEQQIKSGLDWVERQDVPLLKDTRLFNGYPNGIADLQPQKRMSSFPGVSVLSFPEEIPELHQAILAQDMVAVEDLLGKNPMSIYQRCHQEMLPIELAVFCLESSITATLYNFWAALPKAKQWASQRFVEAANQMVDFEQKGITIFDERAQKRQRQLYFQDLIPGLENPLPIYQACLSNNQVLLDVLHKEERAFWENIELACIVGNLRQAQVFFAESLPQSQILFKAFLLGDWPLIETLLQDNFGDDFWKLKHNATDALTYLLWLQNAMQQGVADIDKENARAIYQSIFEQELDLFVQVIQAIETQDASRLKAIGKQYFHYKSERVLYGHHYFTTGDITQIQHYLAQNELVPKELEIYVCLYRGKLDEALLLIQKKLAFIRQHSTLINTVEAGKERFQALLPKRPLLHRQALMGTLSNIDAFVEEENEFNDYQKKIKEIFTHQAQHHKNALNVNVNFELVCKFTKVLVTDNEALEDLTRAFEETLASYTEPEQEQLRQLWEPIENRKKSDLDVLEQMTAEYRLVSKVEKDAQFELYNDCLVLQQGSQVYADILGVKRDMQFSLSIINRMNQPYGQALRACSQRDDFRLNALIRSALLSYEQQDALGYTPLLLAVAANQLPTVKLFFERGLKGNIVVPLRRGDSLYYSLLDNSPSREMTALLLHYYLKPEFTFSYNVGVENKLQILLMYHHHLSEDAFGLSLLDYFALGHSYNIALLDLILKYRDKPVQDGPYDSQMPEDVQEKFRRHNERILLKQKRSVQVSTHQLSFFNSKPMSSIVFQTKEGKRFYPLFKSVEELTPQERSVLPAIFARQFELPENPDSFEKLQEFFTLNILSKEGYLFDIFFDDLHQPVAFYCFKFKTLNSHLFGRFNVIYASIAACESHASQYGLLTSSFKMVLAAKKISDRQQVPLKFYGRFGRPGIAYLLIPKEAQVSTKYHQPNGLLQFIAGAFGNVIERDGSSKPPVQSKAIPVGQNARLEEYNYLLDECLQAHPDNSLPLFFDVDDEVYKSWFEKLSQTSGLTEVQLDELSADDKLLASVEEKSLSLFHQ